MTPEQSAIGIAYGIVAATAIVIGICALAVLTIWVIT